MAVQVDSRYCKLTATCNPGKNNKYISTSHSYGTYKAVIEQLRGLIWSGRVEARLSPFLLHCSGGVAYSRSRLVMVHTLGHTVLLSRHAINGYSVCLELRLCPAYSHKKATSYSPRNRMADTIAIPADSPVSAFEHDRRQVDKVRYPRFHLELTLVNTGTGFHRSVHRSLRASCPQTTADY